MLFKRHFNYFPRFLAVLMTFATFCALISLPACAKNAQAAADDPVKLTASFISGAEITVASDTVILSKTTPISDNNYWAGTVCLVPEVGKSAAYLLNEISDYGQRASGSQYNDLFDGSYSVKGWLRVYYQTATYPRGPAIKITNVIGGYIRYDNSVHVKKQSLNYGCTGGSASTGYHITQFGYQTPTASSWSYNTSSWEYIIANASCNAGATCLFTLVRGTGASPWTLYLDCTVVSNPYL